MRVSSGLQHYRHHSPFDLRQELSDVVGHVNLLSMGSLPPFIQPYASQPHVTVYSLDTRLPLVQQPRHIYAKPSEMPLGNETFTVVYAGHFLPTGIRKNEQSYSIAREAYRVLRRGGLFIFKSHSDEETTVQLYALGFHHISHFPRTGSALNVYSARK